jgi:type IV pilus assembly protein PilP
MMMLRTLILIVATPALAADPVGSPAAPASAPSAATAAPASPTASTPQPVAERELSVKELLGIRDPFKRPKIETKEALAKSPLEKFSLDEFKMVGVVTGPKRLRAMVVVPDGNTYFVAEKDKIGTQKGVVQRIYSDTIEVQEVTVNVLGEEERIMKKISLPTEKEIHDKRLQDPAAQQAPQT